MPRTVIVENTLKRAILVLDPPAHPLTGAPLLPEGVNCRAVVLSDAEAAKLLTPHARFRIALRSPSDTTDTVEVELIVPVVEPPHPLEALDAAALDALDTLPKLRAVLKALVLHVRRREGVGVTPVTPPQPVTP